jgi:aerobic carbon-monoxide dehydrogenase medium subunit
VIPAEVEYVRPGSVDEALAALAEPEAKALAGGQSLVSVLKLRLVRPRLLVDIGGLALRGVDELDGALHIGALTVWRDLEDAPVLRRPALAALADCAAGVGDLQVRNRGTVGGNLAHADPASDLPAVLLALDASIVLRSARGERAVPAKDFLLGPFLTALSPDELLTEIVVPAPPPGSGSAYESVEHPASGFALAGAAALVRADGERSVAVTGISGQAVRLEPAADPEAALAAADVFGDHFASEEYRRQLAAVVARRALARAEERHEEDERWRA